TVTWQGGSISPSTCACRLVVSRTCRAPDLCGNTSACPLTITVQDTNPPSLTCPTNLTVSCSSQVPAPDTNSVTTGDNCGGAVTGSEERRAGRARKCARRHAINGGDRARDSCGNRRTGAQNL